MHYSSKITPDSELLAFNDRLHAAIKNDGRSVFAVAEASGLSRRSIYSALKGPHWLGGDAVQRVCRCLKITPNDLFGFGNPWTREEAAAVITTALNQLNEPTIDDMMKWYASTGGRLENWDHLKDYVDIYAPPTDDDVFVNPVHFGTKGLAAMLMGASDVDQVKGLLRETDRKFCAQSAELHRQVLSGRVEVGISRAFERLPSGRVVDSRYSRFVAAIDTESGPQIITRACDIG